MKTMTNTIELTGSIALPITVTNVPTHKIIEEVAKLVPINFKLSDARFKREYGTRVSYVLTFKVNYLPEKILVGMDGHAVIPADD